MLEDELGDDALHSDESTGLHSVRSSTVGRFHRTHIDEDVPLNGHCTYDWSDEKPRNPHPGTNGGAFSIGFDVS